MSDAGAPGPNPEETAGPGAGAPEDGDAVVPTGEPDAELVAEAGGEDGPPPTAGPDAEAESEGGPATGLPDETLTAEAEAEALAGAAPARGVDLDAVAAEIAGARADIAEVRAGVESMLPDLAAAAREEVVTTAMAAMAREETVAAGNARILRSLDEMVRLTRRADEHVAELHAENQRLRAGELASVTRPMIQDVVRLHDEVAQLASASHPAARDDLQLVGSRLLDTLARWGLSPFAPEVGDVLDTSRHHGVGRVPSADGEPGTVATVRRPGFAHDDGRTFRPAEVEVFVAPPEPAAEPAAPAPSPAAPAAPEGDVTVVVDPPAPPPLAPSPPDPPATGQTEE